MECQKCKTEMEHFDHIRYQTKDENTDFGPGWHCPSCSFILYDNPSMGGE